MVISSRTPEGDPNRCPICGYRCRVEPSCLSPDAPCPRCGHLLWFPADEHRPSKRKQALTPQARSKRSQGSPTVREPEVQAARLIGRLIRRGADKFGAPGRALETRLAAVKDPYQAERLLSLLHEATSWNKLMDLWNTEKEAKASLSRQ